MKVKLLSLFMCVSSFALVLSLFMCVSSFALGQSKNINGTYLSNFGAKIEITNNDLVYSLLFVFQQMLESRVSFDTSSLRVYEG